MRPSCPCPCRRTRRSLLDGTLQQALERALLALGRLDSISTLLPDPDLFIYSYVRKEALLSSQIEGTQSSLSDLLRYELEQAPGLPRNDLDVVEVSNYVAALDHGIARLREDFPLSNRLIREIHGVLLARGRGSDKAPGRVPALTELDRGNAAWKRTLRAAAAHHRSRLHGGVRALSARGRRRFAAAGAGRTGARPVRDHPPVPGRQRTGWTALDYVSAAATGGALREPLLYLSLYFKQNRAAYYELLDRVRREGDWEAWLEFFFEGVWQVATEAVVAAERLEAMFRKDRATIEAAGRRAGSALRVHEALMARPIQSLASAAEATGLSFSGASAAMRLLVDLGIGRELTGKPRDRLFAYDRYLADLAEGTEPI